MYFLAATSYDTSVKLGFILLLAPFWWPVVKAVYQELNTALWSEGGLFGRKPAGAELGKARELRPVSSNPLVSEPWAPRGARAGANVPARSAAASRPRTGQPGLRVRHRRGF